MKYGGGSWGTELFPIPLLSIPVVKGLAEMWSANCWVFGKLPLGSDAVGMALIGIYGVKSLKFHSLIKMIIEGATKIHL